MAGSHYDFIIIGGGSAGSVLANRLSADQANRVLVLEAGRPDYPWDVYIHMPAGLMFPIGNRFYDWKYETEPEPAMGGRRVYHARGKVLGGSSSINGMIFQRGNPMDYERWASDPGMENWDYAHCLPYFKKMETCLAGADEWRGGDGPLVLERGPARSPLFQAFFRACQEAGYPLTKDVVADVPGVGENLQDHLEVYIQYASKQPVSEMPALKWYNRPKVGAEWVLRHTGPAATNHFEGGGFVRSNDDVEYPNLMFHFLPLAIRYDGSKPAADHGYQVHIGPMTSDARGSVKIGSAEPRRKPELRFNYLSTEQDRREWTEAIPIARNILNQPAFEPYSGGELSPGPSVQSPEEILDWVGRDAETALHPSCTAKMGTDDMAVVDPTSMRVHGTEGLRVVDASVFPYIPNGNLYAPVMMTAEKSVDLILGNTPLEPLHVPFYRHEPARVT